MIKKKIFAFLTLIIAPVLLLAQQGGYITFKATVSHREKTKELKFLKGEILPFFQDKEKNKIDVVFGNDTLKIVMDQKNIELLKSVSDHAGDKDQFVLSKKDENMIMVDLNPLDPYVDSVRFVTEDQKITLFSANKKLTITATKAGRYPRLIIPGSPTLFYDVLDLPIYKEKKDKNMADENPTNDSSFPGPLQLIIIIAIVLLLIGWFCWWFFIDREKVKVPVYRQFTQPKLSDFASLHQIKLEKLLKLNPDIDPNYKQLSEQKKQQLFKILKNKNLLIGYVKSKSADPAVDESDREVPGFDNYLPSSGQLPGQLAEDRKPETNLVDVKVIESFLKSMEDRLVRKINDQNSNGQYIQEIDTLRAYLEESKTYCKRLEEKNEQLQQRNNTLTKNLREEENAAMINKQELTHLQIKVISVNFLREYCAQVKDFLGFMNSITYKLDSSFQSLQAAAPDESMILASLLLKFERSRCQKIQAWHNGIVEIVESGVTTNKSLKGIFNRFPQDSDKIYEFKHLLFDELLSKEVSALLIVTEEFKNLNKFFPVPSSVILQVQDKFIHESTLIIQKSAAFGLVPKYVGLFQNYLNFPVRSKSAGRPISAAYTKVGKFEKDTVIEICEFGFETEFGSTDTLVILNKYE